MIRKKRILTLKNPQSKLKPQTFTRLLPNIATVMATCAGLTAIRFALMGQFTFSVAAIIIAAILDAMDGRLARLLGAASDFGAELDSLSDFVSFGVAPTVVLYIFIMEKWRGFGWGICLFYAVCMGLRLARFNVMSRQPLKNLKSADYFMGVPAPAGAMIALFPLILYLATDYFWLISPVVHGTFLCLSGAFMISRLPTFSFKSIQIPSRFVLLTLVIMALVISALFNAPWETLSLCILLYICSIPIAFISFRKNEIDKDISNILIRDKNTKVDKEKK